MCTEGVLRIHNSQCIIENMKILELDKHFLADLHETAKKNERLRMNYDMRTTEEDGSQRMLNALEPGTRVPIHRHMETSETIICLEGKMDIVFYNVSPSSCCDKPHIGNFLVESADTIVTECNRISLCPRDGYYGVQIPIGAWHTVDVHEPSTIFEAKDGAYVLENR